MLLGGRLAWVSTVALAEVGVRPTHRGWGFRRAGWVVFALSSLRHALIQTYTFTTPLYTAVTDRRETYKRVTPKRPLALNLAYLWQRWGGFVQAIATAAQFRCPFFVYCRPTFQVVGDALSWYTWPASRMLWRLTRQLCLTGQGAHWLIPADLGYIVIGPLARLTQRRVFLESTRPILGCLDDRGGGSFLWATGGLVAASREAEFGVLGLLWAAWAAGRVGGVLMATALLLTLSATLWGLFLCCFRRWAYVCWAVLAEVCWVGLSLTCGLMAVEFGEGALIFWAMVWLFVSAVELCLSLFAFVLLAELRGSALS